MNRHLGTAAFLLGLTAIAWVGFGYWGSNALALTMTLLIAAFYLMGALELWRFHQATAGLAAALAAVPAPLARLGDWLDQVHPSLRNPVRLRIEGERVGLPGPAMTPYLVGLLVLLGMLGTFLGMVVTLNGAVMALESTTDLPTIRSALAAPVRGLGLAFGTSVGGVAASAMLGLLSALCRRERLQAAQRLDSAIATDLRGFSLAHQREETLKTLQVQARVMPEVASQLQAMMAQMERQSLALNERLLADQDRFHGHASAAYLALASSVDQSLRESLTASARVAGATIQPVVEATMAGIARETALLHGKVADAVQRQLDGLSNRVETTVTAAADTWRDALARQERTQDASTQGLRETLQRFAATHEQGATRLLASVAATHAALQGDLKATVSGLAQETTRWHEGVAGAVQRQLDGVSGRLDSTVTGLSQAWRDALLQQQRGHDQWAGDLRQALSAVTETFGQQSASLLQGVDQSHAALQADLAASDQQRQAALAQSLHAMAASLQQAWQQAGEQARGQQAQICETWADTARDITTQAEAQTRETVTEIAGLLQAAAQAPRAAVEVMGLLRQERADSLARDSGLLEERARIMATLGTLLEAVNHTATEQRAAIDTLVASSAALLHQVGQQFGERIDAESARMTDVAAQVAGGAVEVASLGEAFGAGVQLFSESSDALVATLQRMEASLGASTARSDEQLAYYVAQAREIIDLSILSQKQIVEDLQQIASRQAALSGEVA